MFGEFDFVIAGGPLRNVTSPHSLAPFLWSMANVPLKIVGNCLTPKLIIYFRGLGQKDMKLSRKSSEKSPKKGSDSAIIVSQEKLFNYVQNCLQWGRPILVDPTEWPRIRLLNQDFGNMLSIFPRRNRKTPSSLNFLQSGPWKFTKSDFSGLAPIRRVLICDYKQKTAKKVCKGRQAE